MGTKRAFNEDLQEFIDHPKHFNYGNKPASFSDDGRKHFRTDDSPESENDVTVPYMVHKEFKTTAPLPLVTGIGTDDSDSGSVPVFNPNLFFLEYNFPSRKLFCYDDIYSNLLNRPPRKSIPIGPDHQADIPEFNSELARNYKNNSEMNSFLGVRVVGIHDSDGIRDSAGIRHSAGIVDSDSGYPNCDCVDGGSIRCVQQHVKEARTKLMEFYGREKFVDLGMTEMGEEVACNWSEEEERLFHEVVYLNSGSFRKWNQLSVVFPTRKSKELVSYYFNVFILRRRAVQNRSTFLEIDSDDDEWRESYGGSFGYVEDDDDFVVGGGFGSYGDDESGSEDGGGGVGGNDGGGGGEEDTRVSFKDQPLEPEVGAKSSF